MKDEDKTKAQLMRELEEARQRIVDLEKAETPREPVEEVRRLLGSFIDYLPYQVYVKNTQSEFLFANKAVLDALRLETLDDLVGLTDLDLIPGEFAEVHYAEEQKLFQTGEPIVDREVWSVAADGSKHWSLNTKVPLQDDEGKIIGLIGINHGITHLKQVEEALRRSEEQYRTLVENVNIGVYRNTGGPKGRFLQANSAIARMFGYDSVEEFMEVSVSDLYEHPENRKEFVDEIVRRGSVRDVELCLHKRDASLIWGSCTARAQFNTDGEVEWIDGVIEDVTRRKQIEEALRESEERYRDLFENSNDLIQSVDSEGHFVYVNRTWRETLGYGEEEIDHLSLEDIIHPDSQSHCMEVFKHVLSGEKVDNVEAVFVAKDGREIVVEGSVNCRFSDGVPLYTRGIFRDITERKRLEEELKRQATTDPLTGVDNRRQFLGKAQREWMRCRRYERLLSLLMIDIDHFKHINDTFGHSSGDQVLKAMAEGCNGLLREADVFGRMGGEEFGVVLIEADAKSALDVAERLRKDLSALSVHIDKEQIRFTVSIGLTCIEKGDDSLEDTIRRADIALYEAKNRGRNCVIYR